LALLHPKRKEDLEKYKFAFEAMMAASAGSTDSSEDAYSSYKLLAA